MSDKRFDFHMPPLVLEAIWMTTSLESGWCLGGVPNASLLPLSPEGITT
jgi:hypothetical protein